jgi:hypothetical protein
VSREYRTLVSEYALGESQRRSLSATSLKRFVATVPRTASEWATLKAFIESVKGGLLPFYVYEMTETSPAWSWDASGVATVGRFTVCFDMPGWGYTLSWPRVDTELRMVEVS